MTPTIQPVLNLVNLIDERYYISTIYDIDFKNYQTSVFDMSTITCVLEQTTTSYRMAQGNHQRALETYVNKTKQIDAQIIYEYSYNCYAVRTTLPLKGRGITKSEQTEGLYYATEKALEKLKTQYKCTPNIDHSI